MSMATIKRLNEEAQVKFQQAQDVLSAETFSEDDLDKAKGLREEAQALKARASELVKIQEGMVIDQPKPEKNDQPTSFKSWRDWVGAMSTAVRTKGAQVDPRLRVYEAAPGESKDLSGATGSGGGFLIPEAQMEEIMGVAAPMQIVRPRATRLPMSTRSIRVPRLDQDGTTAGEPHFFGGIDVNWMEEGAAITETDPNFGEAELVARELVGATTVSNSLLRDAPALAAFLGSRRGFPGAISWKEEYAFLQGNGVGKPLGIVNSPATVSVTRTSSSAIKYDDLANMEAAFMGEEPVWIASISAKAELLLMNGPSGNAAYLWGNAAEGRPSTLLGHPIMFTDKLPALGTTGDILLADLSYYLIGTLQDGTSVESDQSQKFTSNKTVFRVVHRVDGMPWLNNPITLADGATEVSPFVKIAT